MSVYPNGVDLSGNIDYQRLKRHYDYDDYARIPFLAAGLAEQVYVAGTRAFNPGNLPWTPPTLVAGLNPTAVADPTVPTAGTFPIPPLPPGVNVGMFEAKVVLLITDQDVLVRFEPDYTVISGASTRVQQLIQAAFSPYTLFRRFTALHMVGNVLAGNLDVTILG